jgi:signal transduction histidine kinase
MYGMKAFLDHLRQEATGNLAFVATVVAAYVSLFFAARGRLAPETLALAVGLGVVYTVLGLWCFEEAENQFARGKRLLSWVYLGVQVAIVSAILYITDALGFTTLLYFPLVSHAMYVLPWRQALVAFAFIVAGFVAVITALAGLATALANSAIMAAGVVFVAVFTRLAIREHNVRRDAERLASELAEANQRLRAYAVQAEELATVRERNRLAREIHDSLGHYLTVINVQLEAAQLLLAGSSDSGQQAARALDALHKAQSLAQEGLADVRRSVAALRAPATEQRPLPEALAALAEETEAGGIVTRFRLLGQPRPLPAQAELTLYRAAQEGLTNLRKHSRASRAELILDYADSDRVRLVVQDNGVGAALEETPNAFGLLGLRERVQLLNGQVRLQTAPGQGFTLEVTV